MTPNADKVRHPDAVFKSDVEDIIRDVISWYYHPLAEGEVETAAESVLEAARVWASHNGRSGT